MECSGRIGWKPRAVTLLAGLVLAGAGISGLQAQETTEGTDPFGELRQRIEQLEQDNLALKAAIQNEEAARLGAMPALEDDEQIDVAAEASPHGVSFLDPTDAAQQSEISALQKGLQALTDKANKKNYPSIAVNGVFQADMGYFHQDADSLAEFGRIKNGADFRRARLSAKGAVTEHTNYFFQMDFGFFGRPTFTDVWLEQTDVPLFGNVRVGQWKQPFSLEVVSSFRYTTFMERALTFQTFTAFRHLGVGFYNHSEDLSMTWAASVFAAGQDQYGGSIATGGGVGTAERVTFLPVWENAGKEYLHLGAGHYFSAPQEGRVAFRTIPELFIGQNANAVAGTSGQPVPTGPANGTPFVAQTGMIIASCFNVLGSELLWVEGPFSLQTEGMLNFVDQAGGPIAVLPGGYVQAGYFLTGEHRPYDRKAGAIDRVIPKTNLAFCNCNGGTPGIGAWEVAARVSYINLNNDLLSAYRGGEATDFTAGINWFWNPYTKIVFNYIHSVANTTQNTYTIANPPNTPGFYGHTTTDIFAMRAQIDF